MKKKSLVKNASDRKQVKEADDKEKFLADREVDDLGFVLNTESGRRVIWSLLESCGVFTSSVHHSGSMTYFNEGRRSVGLKYLSEISDNFPQYLIQMMKTNNESE
jgi:hypothetical protein